MRPYKKQISLGSTFIQSKLKNRDVCVKKIKNENWK